MNDILSASPRWADVSVGDLYAIGRCACGMCKTIELEVPPEPPNPSWRGSGRVGEIDIQTQAGDFISVAVHAQDGSLVSLDIVCEFGFKKVPEEWIETERNITVY